MAVLVLPEITNISTTIDASNLRTGVITAEKIVANDIRDDFGNKFVTFRDLEYYHNRLMKEYCHREKENKNFTCMFNGEC